MESQPIKVNLYLTDFDSFQESRLNIVGGSPNKIIENINNISYPYLQGLYIDDDGNRNKIWFKFDDNLNMKTDIPGSKYLDKGGITAVFAGEYINTDINVLSQLSEKKLIFRMVETFESDSIENWINKYKSDKTLFTSNLIDIYMYGGIYSPNKGLVSYYVMTRFYYDWENLFVLSYQDLNIWFNSFLSFLSKVNDLKYFYRDLKLSNIGMDRNLLTNEPIFIVLDYDDITLINKTSSFLDNFKSSGCFGKYCSGTLIPYYIIKDYFNINSEWINKFDKIYVVGLATIIISLYFEDNLNKNELLELLFGPSRFSSCIHYYKFMQIYDSKLIYDKLINLIIGLIPKYSEIDDSKKTILMYFIMNLLDKNYSIVNKPQIILEDFEKISNNNNLTKLTRYGTKYSNSNYTNVFIPNPLIKNKNNNNLNNFEYEEISVNLLLNGINKLKLDSSDKSKYRFNKIKNKFT